MGQGGRRFPRQACTRQSRKSNRHRGPSMRVYFDPSFLIALLSCPSSWDTFWAWHFSMLDGSITKPAPFWTRSPTAKRFKSFATANSLARSNLLKPASGKRHGRGLGGSERCRWQNAQSCPGRTKAEAQIKPYFDELTATHATRKLSFRIGMERMRAWTALNRALPMAGAMPMIGVSPAPADTRSGRSRSTVSISGTSLNRGTR
jgi:hypothetical protein